jgi:hypothetical protein
MGYQVPNLIGTLALATDPIRWDIQVQHYAVISFYSLDANKALIYAKYSR